MATIDSSGQDLSDEQNLLNEVHLVIAFIGNPTWIKDSGLGGVTVSDCTLYMNLKASNQNGILKVDFSKVDVIITNYEVKLDG